MNAASAAMMLVSSIKAAESTVSTFTDKGASNLDRFSSGLSTVASTAMTAGTMMKVLGDTMLGPWGVALGILIAIGGALVGIISGAQKAKKEAAKEDAADRLEQYTEQYEKLKEADVPKDEFNELYRSYEKLAKGSQEAADAQEALIEKAKEVAEAYKDANLYLAATSGNIEEVLK